MSSLTQNPSKKQAELQQQLAKRQQALAKIEERVSLSNKKTQVEVAKGELEKARIDLLNAKIHLNEVPSEDKVGQLYAQAKVKEAEANVLKGRAQLYSQQDELKALKASFIEVDNAQVLSDEDEPDDNIAPAFDIAFQKIADADDLSSDNDVASVLVETSVSQLEDSIMDYLTTPPEPPESEMPDFEIESAETILNNRILGHFFKSKWPNDYEMSHYATVDMVLEKETYAIVTMAPFENRFYLHAARFSVSTGQIIDSEYFRKPYKTEGALYQGANVWLGT